MSSNIAHFQDGPATGRMQVVKQAKLVLVVPVELPPPSVVLEGAEVQPRKYTGYEYTQIGGWKDKYGNLHYTYAPTDLIDGFAPLG